MCIALTRPLVFGEIILDRQRSPWWRVLAEHLETHEHAVVLADVDAIRSCGSDHVWPTVFKGKPASLLTGDKDDSHVERVLIDVKPDTITIAQGSALKGMLLPTAFCAVEETISLFPDAYFVVLKAGQPESRIDVIVACSVIFEQFYRDVVLSDLISDRFLDYLDHDSSCGVTRAADLPPRRRVPHSNKQHAALAHHCLSTLWRSGRIHLVALPAFEGRTILSISGLVCSNGRSLRQYMVEKIHDAITSSTDEWLVRFWNAGVSVDGSYRAQAAPCWYRAAYFRAAEPSKR